MSGKEYFEEITTPHFGRQLINVVVVLVVPVAMTGGIWASMDPADRSIQAIAPIAVGLSAIGIYLAYWITSNRVDEYVRWVTPTAVGYRISGPDVTREIPVNDIERVELLETTNMQYDTNEVLARANLIQLESSPRTYKKIGLRRYPATARLVVGLKLSSGEGLWFDTDQPEDFKRAIERARGDRRNVNK
jgi:hypothetical protein